MGTAAGAMLAIAATPAAAAAVQQADSGANQVKEIVVTAEFREQTLQKTPLAITAVNAATLDARDQHSIQDVAAQAPNVTLKPLGAALGSSLGASIRGIGQFDFNFAMEPGVGMYVDDVYYATLTGSVFDLLDLDRVEVLRGPQGTLAGKNSIGGAIKLYSKRPTGAGGGYLEATYGGYNRIDARGSVDFTLVSDKLFMRLAAVTRQHDGYVDQIDFACANPSLVTPGFPHTNVGAPGCKIGSTGGQSMAAVRASLRWLPSDKVEVNIIADATQDKSEVQATTLLRVRNKGYTLAGVPYDSRFIPSDPYITYATFSNPTDPFGAYSLPNANHLHARGVSGTVDLTLADNLSLKSITAYRYYDGEFVEDGDQSPMGLEQTYNYVSHNQFTQEVRLNGSLFNQAVDYTVGGFYLHENSANSGRIGLNYANLEFMEDDHIPAETSAGFAQVVWHATDKMNLTGGIRYTSESKSYTYGRSNPDGSANPIVGSLNGITGSYSGSHWDYRANLAYQWTPDVMTYAQFSTGFKGGGVNPRPFVPSQAVGFGQETLDAYELGFKSLFLDRRLRVNGSAFYNDYNGIQLTLDSCPQFSNGFPACALPYNAGNAHISGVELESEFNPVAGLSINGSVSYLRFKYTYVDPNAMGADTNADGIGDTGVQLGMTAPYTPKWKWSVGAQYAFDLAGAGTLTPRIDASYQGPLFAGATNRPTNRIKAYTLLNGQLTWRAPENQWEVSLAVSNLTNKLYYMTVFDNYSNYGAEVGQPGMPRTWSVTVRRSF